VPLPPFPEWDSSGIRRPFKLFHFIIPDSWRGGKAAQDRFIGSPSNKRSVRTRAAQTDWPEANMTHKTTASIFRPPNSLHQFPDRRSESYHMRVHIHGVRLMARGKSSSSHPLLGFRRKGRNRQSFHLTDITGGHPGVRPGQKAQPPCSTGKWARSQAFAASRSFCPNFRPLTMPACFEAPS